MIIVNNKKFRNIVCYAVCTESLKHGIRHGVWLDLTLEVEDLKMEIVAMLAASLFAGKTGWCITCFETPLPFRFLDSHTSLARLHKMACFIEEFKDGDFGAKLLERYWGNVDEAKDTIFNQYMGDFKNIHEFVKNYLARYTKTPKSVIDAVNTKKLWQEWQQDKFFVIPTHPHGVQIFRKTWKPVVLE